MTGTISLRTFKQTVQGAGDKAVLRLGQSDDSITTAKRGLGGRIVRFFNGGLDKADNTKIAGQFLQGLKDKYGSEIGEAAFRMARPDTKQAQDGNLYTKASKPLTVRQVRDALSYARDMRQGAEQSKATTALATLYAPENVHKFAKVLADRNIDPGDLTKAHKAFYKESLNEQVRAATEENHGVPPQPAEVRRLAGKVLAYTASMDAGELRDHARSLDKARDAGLALAGTLGGGSARDVAPMLNDFLNRADARLEDVTLGGGSGSAGGDDIVKTRLATLDTAIKAIPPHQAKAMYEAAMAPDGAGRTMLFALNAKTSDPKVSGDMPAAAAAYESAGYLKNVLKALGERGGIKDAEAMLDRIEDAGQQVKRADFATGARLGGVLIQTAGIGSRGAADKALGAATALIDERKPLLAERERLAVERDRAGMLQEQEDERLRAEAGSRRGSVSFIDGEGSSSRSLDG